jgi:hypothetical protein
MARGNRQKDRSHTFVGRQTHCYHSRRHNEAYIFEADNITHHCQSIGTTIQTYHQSASESTSAARYILSRQTSHSSTLQMCCLVPQNASGHRRRHASTTKCLAPTFHRQHFIDNISSTTFHRQHFIDNISSTTFHRQHFIDNISSTTRSTYSGYWNPIFRPPLTVVAPNNCLSISTNHWTTITRWKAILRTRNQSLNPVPADLVHPGASWKRPVMWKKGSLGSSGPF